MSDTAPLRKLLSISKKLSAQSDADVIVDRAIKTHGALLRADGLFDDDFYAAHNPDVVKAGIDPLRHYLRYGHAEGRWPSKTFDTTFYRTQHLNGDATECPLLHYVREGRERSLPTMANIATEAGPVSNPSPGYEGGEAAQDSMVDKLVETYAARLRDEGLFDDGYYAGHSPDVKDSGVDLLWHYLRYGHAEGRWPSPRFDTNFYRAEYMGGDTRTVPLLHYLVEGHQADLPTNRAMAFQALRKVDGYQPGPTPGVSAAPFDDFRAFCMTSGLFDEDYYSLEHQDVALSDTAPFDHFMTHGWQDGRNPSRIFSLEWYRTAHLNEDRSINPLLHYFETGVHMGLSPISGLGETADLGAFRKLSQRARFVYPDDPEITVAIVNFNGRDHLADLMTSLSNLEYASFRVMIVDNGSTDGSVDWLRRNAPFVDLVELPDNIGFADACNLAMDRAPTQLVAMLNNDMIVDRMWLRTLVDALRAEPQVAAVTSKILFFKPFVTVTVQSDQPFILSAPDLLAHHKYQKYFVEQGQAFDDMIASFEDHAVSVKLPYEPGCAVEIHPRASDDGIASSQLALTVKVNGFPVLQEQGSARLELDPTVFEDCATWVLNNAGSHETSRDVVGDRGFGMYDIGQYDKPENVDYLCGGSFLINRSALNGRPLFLGDLFAYFEDTELSVRLRQDGYRIGYVPGSIAFHKHASTSKEKSVFFQRRVERNYSAFFARKCGLHQAIPQISQTQSRLNHLAGYYSDSADSTVREKQLADVFPEVVQELETLQDAFLSGKEFLGSHRALRIGIYNSYWATGGGGELHALNVGHYLSRFGVVDLISESDFDLDALLARFDLPRARFRKVLLYPLAPADTAAYDVFLNSTYGSNLVSRAPYSYYIVSFPRKGASPKMLKSYTFLPNSEYTNHWCKTFWGEQKTELLHPLVRDVGKDTVDFEKDKIILHVGRFFPDGHSKRQHEIVRTFKELVERHPEFSDWHLVCAGGLDRDRDDCLAYFEHVSALAHGSNIQLLPNAGFDTLNALYLSAAIYWHATGFDAGEPEDPYSNEHFGISVVEAMSACCIPVVLDKGGPADIVNSDQFGSKFQTRDEWISETASWMRKFDEAPDAFARSSLSAAAAARTYQDEAFSKRMAEIFQPVEEADAAVKRTRGIREFAADAFWRFIPPA